MRLSPSIILGLAGPIAAGKTTLAHSLEKYYQFVHLRSRNVLSKMLLAKGLEVTELNLQNIGKEMIRTIGGAGLSELVLKDYNPEIDCVYDSIRHVGDIDYFKKRFGDSFFLLFIDSEYSVRVDRYAQRSERESSLTSFNERMSHPVEAEVEGLREIADARIVNIDVEVTTQEVIRLINEWKQNIKFQK